jgi:hypothetical protein
MGGTASWPSPLLPIAAMGMSKLGSMAAGGGSSGGGIDVQGGVSQANKILGKSLTSALGYSEKYTNKGVDTQTDYYGKATDFLQQALAAATQQATSNIKSGLSQSIATNAPVVQAGYDAMDRYKDSLGMSRAAMGTGALAQALQSNPDLLSNVQGLQSGYQSVSDLLAQNGSNAGYTDQFTGYTSGKYDVNGLISGNAFNQDNINKTLTGPTAAETASQAKQNGITTNVAAAEASQAIKNANLFYGSNRNNDPIPHQYAYAPISYAAPFVSNLDPNTAYQEFNGYTNFNKAFSQDPNIGTVAMPKKGGLHIGYDANGQFTQILNEPADSSRWGAFLPNIQDSMANIQAGNASNAYNTSNANIQNIQNAYNAYNQNYGLLQSQLQGMSGYTASQALAAQQGLFGPVRII